MTFIGWAEAAGFPPALEIRSNQVVGQSDNTRYEFRGTTGYPGGIPKSKRKPDRGRNGVRSKPFRNKLIFLPIPELQLEKADFPR